MQAAFGVKGTEGINNNCQVFIFCRGEQRLGKYNQHPMPVGGEEPPFLRGRKT